ncbi:exonuclease domain-containing protein [Kocuria sp. CCUG 69068]|uniref:exonuclease domain-containing protein n=1 Tax=Kocuria sp. CCUG 69068 TaxID=2043138 RepID=UPI001E520738
MSTVSGLDFVAVDFETANGKRESACAVGVAVVRGGEVTNSESWLIRPPSSAAWFNQRNTAIHGITKEECMAGGIPWPETAQRLEQLCSGLPVVAHNASFDEAVWAAANRASGVEAPLPAFHCTLQLSRGHLDLVNHKLPTVAHHLGLDDFPHHRAEADAMAAAQITVELARRTGASTVDELWERAPRRSATGYSAARPASTRRAPDSVFRSQTNRPTTGPSLADPGVPAPTSLDGEVVVITGELTFGEREAVEERLREAGAGVAKSTTKKVTCLVIAAGADVRNPPLTGATGKEKLAVQRIGEGQRIAVIGEPELRELLEQAEVGSSAETDTAPPAVLEEDEPAIGAATRSAVEEPVFPAVEKSEEVELPSGESRETAVPAEAPIDAPAPAAEEQTVARPLAPGPAEPACPQESSYPAHSDYSMYQPKSAGSPPRSVPVPSTAGQQTPSSTTRSERRWVFHVVMWSAILFLTVGMLIVGMVMSLVGVPETTWAAVIGISWLIAPVVFLVWLVMTIVRVVRSRRQRDDGSA